MKPIQVSKFKTSELNSEFNSVKSIEIENNPFDKGAFGEVYFCNSINGAAITSKQVLKIFIDDGTGSAKRGYETIVKLQEQIVKHNQNLKQKNEKPIQQINALGALPQFSFEGLLNGKKVLGYSANLLSKNEWMLFGQIFNEDDLNKRKQLRNQFYNLPVDHRLKMANDLVEGFYHLEQMKFIYADLNPKNFFVNESKGQLCLIDYEGGAINDNPETYGKPGEWLAPEIQEQLLNSNSPIIKVDLNTDTWAVAIGVHFMLFNFHPLFFLKVRGKKEMENYFKKYKWPDIDKNNYNFRTELDGTYNWYINKLNTEISPSLKAAISDTINNGYNNPNRRLSYKQWTMALGKLMQPPVIKDFSADRKVIIKGVPISLKWDVERAHTLTIDNGVGNVTGKKEIKVSCEKNTTFNLKAVGHFGEVEKSVDITIFPTPVIDTLFVPTPSFSNNVKIENFVLSRPQVDVRINFHSTISFKTPEFKGVKTPAFNTQLPSFPKPKQADNIIKRFMKNIKLIHDEKN
jgi:serine/threonine protein kinase